MSHGKSEAPDSVGSDHQKAAEVLEEGRVFLSAWLRKVKALSVGQQRNVIGTMWRWLTDATPD